MSSRLPRLMNRKFVDDFAVEFCMSMNTKANRKKLARALFSVDKNRWVCGVGGKEEGKEGKGERGGGREKRRGDRKRGEEKNAYYTFCSSCCMVSISVSIPGWIWFHSMLDLWLHSTRA